MAYPFKTILTPMQFDDPELIAFRVAKQLTEEHKATLCLLHIVPILPAIGEPHVAATAHEREEDRAKARLQELADQHLKGVNYQILTRVAGPSDTAAAVLEAAREINADLIVMKTHGRRGISHLFLGSVAEKVVREAPCAVITLTTAAKQRFTD
ncbi:MAG: universal stress protein [Candidatus Binataceae bacterium]